MFFCDFSVGTMMSPDMQPKREFSARYQPENCKEVEMINYLIDCYDRAGLEERLAPKVSLESDHFGIFESVSEKFSATISWFSDVSLDYLR